MPKNQNKSLFEGDQAEDIAGGYIIRVAFESGVDNEFDYLVPDKLWPVEIGKRVEAPFGKNNKIQKGFCVNLPEDKEHEYKFKIVKQVIDKEPLLGPQLIELARWISSYYVCPLGQVLAAMVPAAVKKGAGAKKEQYTYLSIKKDAQSKLTSKKQKLIIELLTKAQAFGPKSAVSKKSLLIEADCREGVLKTLSRKEVTKIISRQVLKSLPVIPEGAVASSSDKEIVLNNDQVNALSKINSQIDTRNFGVTMLHGITDSGKTEVYIRAIQTAVEKRKTSIVLLPEIALTTQTIERFSSRFEKIALMHSALTAAQRNTQWQKIKTGQADVVIGARSAVFAPLSNIGLIIVDEEHEPSYKQDTVPRYHGRDVAVKRAQLAGAHCLLGSATPSLETLNNCKTKKHYNLISLPKRVMDLPMPEMKLVDISAQFSKNGVTLVGSELEDQLNKVLERGEQAILLLNRRGYSNFVFCPSCRHTLRCRNCDVTLTFHKRPGKIAKQNTITGGHLTFGYAICHYCLAKMLVPQKCPLCNRGMTMIGLGSQRLEEELADKFPDARVARVDSDSMQAQGAQKYYHVLRDFAQGQTDILAGTQMLAKGLHFPNVTLVGIISADTALSLPDFRANERTFQLISQVAGRAGRSVKRGTVIVQTLLPGQPAIQFALNHDYQGFVRAELSHRKKCNLPPYWRMAIVGLRDTKFDKLTKACEAMKWRLDTIIEQEGLNVRIRGPMPATISRIQRFHRMQIIVQAATVKPIQKLFANLRSGPAIRPSVNVIIDIDPINLL